MKIEDELITPYYIKVDDRQFTVMLSTGNVDKEGKEVDTPQGYYSSIGSAVKKIVSLKVSNKEDTTDLKGYISSLEDLFKTITNKLNING